MAATDTIEEQDENRWTAVAERILAGGELERSEALEVLQVPDSQLDQLLDATRRVREAHFGRRVKLCVLQNARSGLCPEDCNYCSQSIVSKAEIDRYRMLPKEVLLKGARHAVERGARRYCMVTSGRGPSGSDVDKICDATRTIRSEFPELEICACLGLLDDTQAASLKDAGVGWVNHNLNTSERFHPKICTTHEYADRLRTVQAVKRAGLSLCSGGIIGMGEESEDVVELAFALRELGVDSLPVNFLHPIDGTPMADRPTPEAGEALRALCLFRLANPRADIRAAGGRERSLGERQALAIHAASSIFVEGYLTTSGQSPDDARTMIESMGYVVEDAPSSVSDGLAIGASV